MISSRRPPTRIPAMPSTQPGITEPLLSGNEVGALRLHEESKVLPPL